MLKMDDTLKSNIVNSKVTAIDEKEPSPDLHIGLSLSGGGVRAAIFHLGVLRFLAEAELLERVEYVSTVSGGSLLAGLVFDRAGYRWPDSGSFLASGGIHEQLKTLLLSTDLERNYLFRLLLPWNWHRLSWRANVVADSIRSVWGIKRTLSALPLAPVWAINGTTMETGRRWRFRVAESEGKKVAEMGDGLTGYTNADHIPLAEALATSAAFPGGITPLRLSKRRRTWRQPFHTDSSTREFLERLPSLHIADGGVYDNLGTEPLFDASTRRIRRETNCNFLIVSDAGAPLGVKPWGPLAQLMGFSKRTLDIIHSQSRHLRTRSFVGAIAAKEVSGIFISIAEAASTAASRTTGPTGDGVHRELGDMNGYLDDKAVRFAASYPTRLWKPQAGSFALIERHGYECAKVQWMLHGPARCGAAYPTAS